MDNELSLISGEVEWRGGGGGAKMNFGGHTPFF